MKKTILVIAHNEEENIEKCLKSVSSQNPDELIVICHNCSDRTIEISKRFQTAKVIDYRGPEGVIYARIEGFKHVTNEIVACIDGDSWALPGWLERLTSPLDHPDVSAVAGLVLIPNSLFGFFACLFFFIIHPIFKKDFKFYFWGANFACRKSDYEKVGGLEDMISLKNKIGLHFWTDDLYLSLMLEKIGKVVPALGAVVFAKNKNTPLPKGTNRWKLNNIDKMKVFDYFDIDRKQM